MTEKEIIKFFEENKQEHCACMAMAALQLIRNMPMPDWMNSIDNSEDSEDSDLKQFISVEPVGDAYRLCISWMEITLRKNGKCGLQWAEEIGCDDLKLAAEIMANADEIISAIESPDIFKYMSVI